MRLSELEKIPLDIAAIALAIKAREGLAKAIDYAKACRLDRAREKSLIKLLRDPKIELCIRKTT